MPAGQRDRSQSGGVVRVRLLALLLVRTLVVAAVLMPAFVDAAPVGAAPGDIADLVIGKQDSPDPVIPGTTLTYTISVDNLGPATATGVVVVDPLPSGVTVGALPAGCSAAGQTVTCQFADIPVAPAPLPSVQFTVSVNPDARGSLTNTVSVSSVETDPNPDDNTISAPTSLSPRADVALTKSDAPDPVAAGGTLTYTLSATNNGPSTGTSVTITDTLPPEVTFASATPPCTGTTTLTCPLGALTPGAGTSLLITGTVALSTVSGTSLTNSATVSHGEADQNPGNNTATATTTVQAPATADLAITKGDAPDPVTAGGPLTYTLVVTNNGPDDASSILVTDTLPPGTTFASADPSCAESTGVVTCPITNLAAGATQTLVISVSVQPGVPVGTILVNGATVAAVTADPDPTNNTAGASTLVDASADLSITKSDAPDPVEAGAEMTYTLTVTNNGPSDATGVTITDPVVSGAVFVAAPGCTEAAGTITCGIGDLAFGASAVVTIVVRVLPDIAAGVTNTNTATVSAATPDPDPSNNAATATTQVVAPIPPVPGRSISGHVFNDLDGNGRLDPGEPDLGGVVVRLTNAGPDGVLDTRDDVPIASVTTSSPYGFANLSMGTYRVIIETGTVPSGLVATGDFDGGTDSRADVVLGSDQSVTGVDFGYHDAPAVGSGGSGLPFTGGQFGMSIAVAAGAILAGALMLLVGRRRGASALTRR